MQKFNDDFANISVYGPSFDVVKSLYFSAVVMWRPDIRALYLKHCNPAPCSSTHPFPEVPQHARRRTTIVPFIAKSAKPPKAPLPVVKLDSDAKMSVGNFATFLASSQDRESVDLEEAASIIATYDTFSGKSDTSYISMKGFAHYLLDQEASQLHQQPQNMDLPLSEYLIASSHNTYLTGHQLHGDSSVNMYSRVSVLFH